MITKDTDEMMSDLLDKKHRRACCAVGVFVWFNVFIACTIVRAMHDIDIRSLDHLGQAVWGAIPMAFGLAAAGVTSTILSFIREATK